ncbi:unnamed protein product [Ectocarpus sp. 4 AP-2014]
MQQIRSLTLLNPTRLSEEGIDVYGMFQEGKGLKEYLHGPMNAGTKLKVELRTGDIGLRERSRRLRKVDDERRLVQM